LEAEQDEQFVEAGQVGRHVVAALGIADRPCRQRQQDKDRRQEL
jgi:hypothetical protein